MASKLKKEELNDINGGAYTQEHAYKYRLQLFHDEGRPMTDYFWASSASLPSEAKRNRDAKINELFAGFPGSLYCYYELFLDGDIKNSECGKTYNPNPAEPN